MLMSFPINWLNSIPYSAKENNINTTPEHISIVGCSLISNDKQAGFAHQFINALDQQGIRSSVSARVTEVAVDSNGHKYTKR